MYPGLEFEMRESTIPHNFNHLECSPYTYNHGFFTKHFIPKGSLFHKFDKGSEATRVLVSNMRDPMADIRKISTSRTNVEMYDSLKEFCLNYYDRELMKKVNIRACVINGTLYLETIKDIYPGEELLRMRGLSAWMVIVRSYINLKTIFAYANILKEFSDKIHEYDPYNYENHDSVNKISENLTDLQNKNLQECDSLPMVPEQPIGVNSEMISEASKLMTVCPVQIYITSSFTESNH